MRNSTLLQNKYGFTLVELILVIAVLGILAGIAVPRYLGFAERARIAACRTNVETVERLYQVETHTENDLNHSDVTFEMFLNKVGSDLCPSGGVYYCVDGAVRCSLHDEGGENKEKEENEVDEDDDGGEVPYL